MSSLHVETSPGAGELARRAASFRSAIRVELRKTFASRAAANIRTMADSLRSGTFATDVGMREGIASGLRVEEVSTAKGVGVRIISTGDGLEESRKPMVRAWQRESWTHPVFGNTDVEVTQEGRPYFTDPDKDSKPTTLAVLGSLGRAADALGGH